MNINKTSINKFRRKLMSFITKNIGKNRIQKPLDTVNIEEIKRILIIRPNHRLGNLLLITPLIEEITMTFSNCKIDVLAKGNLAPILYGNYKTIDSYLLLPRKPFSQLFRYMMVCIKITTRHYDLVINAVEGSSSGKILTKISNANYKVFGDVEEVFLKFRDGKHMAKNSIYNLRCFLNPNKLINGNDIPLLDIKLNTFEKEKGRQLLKRITKNEKPVIAIFTYATGSKCYCMSWWNDFYIKLKIEYPKYQIIEILPIENVSQIQFKAISFYSKNIREVASVIANVDIFIGADSGMMHLASASLTTTIGLFSKTNSDRYKPYGCNNFAINTNTTSIDECMPVIRNVLFSGSNSKALSTR